MKKTSHPVHLHPFVSAALRHGLSLIKRQFLGSLIYIIIHLRTNFWLITAVFSLHASSLPTPISKTKKPTKEGGPGNVEGQTPLVSSPPQLETG